MAQRKASAAQNSLRSSPFQADPRTGTKPSIGKIILRSLLLAPQAALNALKVLLPTSIFFFKFLEWCYSSTYARSRLSSNKGTASAPALRPPSSRPMPHPDGVCGEDDVQPGVCPVCKKPIANPTALPTGYVGDYRCLYDYVEKEGRCPVTRLKVAIGDLRKING